MQRVWRVSLVWRMDACARISPFPRDLNDVSLISLVRPLARHLYSSPCTRSSQLYTTEVQAFIFSGETPLDIVEEYTLHSGRMTPLPDWILSGAWRRLSLRPEVARLKGRCVGVSTPPRCDLRSALSLTCHMVASDRADCWLLQRHGQCPRASQQVQGPWHQHHRLLAPGLDRPARKSGAGPGMRPRPRPALPHACPCTRLALENHHRDAAVVELGG